MINMKVYLSKQLNQLPFIMIGLLCFLTIVHGFTQSDIIYFFIAFLAIYIFLHAIRKVPKLTQYVVIFLTICGVLLSLVDNHNVAMFVSHINLNIPILTLLFIVPLIAIPFKIHGVFESVKSFIRANNEKKMSVFSVMTSFIFLAGPVLNLGTIRILHEMIEDLPFRNPVLTKVYHYGFSSVVFWSPYFASVVLAIYYFPITVSDYLFIGFTFGFFVLVVGNLLFYIWVKKNSIFIPEMAPTTDQKGEIIEPKRLLAFVVIIMFLIIQIMLLEKWTGWAITLIVGITSIGFFLLYVTVTREKKHISKEWNVYKEKVTNSMNNEISLFIGSGIFGSSFSQTSYAKTLSNMFISLIEHSFILFSTLIIVTIVALAFIGIHQLVVVPIIAVQLQPIVGIVPAELLAFVLILAWAISAVVSPLTAFNLMVGSLVKQTSLTVGLRWNWSFAVFLFVAGILFVSIHFYLL